MAQPKKKKKMKKEEEEEEEEERNTDSLTRGEAVSDINTRCIINQVFDWPASARESVARA